MRGWGADANTVDRNQYEDASFQQSDQPPRFQRDHQPYQQTYQRHSESFQQSHPDSRSRYPSQNYADVSGRRNVSYSNQNHSGQARGHWGRNERQVSQGRGRGVGSGGDWKEPSDHQQQSEDQQRDGPSSDHPAIEQPISRSRNNTRQSSGPPGILSPTRAREGGILHAVELGHRSEGSKRVESLDEKVEQVDEDRWKAVEEDTQDQAEEQSADKAGNSEPTPSREAREPKNRPPGLPSPLEDYPAAPSEPIVSDETLNVPSPDNASDEARLAAEIWGTPSTSQSPTHQNTLTSFPPAPPRHSAYSNARWITENRPSSSNRPGNQYLNQTGAGPRFPSYRGEEYKAEIRHKIERLEDDDKPAFVKATKEKERSEKGDERWEKAGGSDGWGVLDGTSAGYNERPNSGTRGWSNGGEGRSENRQAGPERSAWNGPSAGHRLQGDVSRRIPDAGWGPRGRGSRRGSGKLSARGEERSETSSMGNLRPAEPSGPASTKDANSVRSHPPEEHEQEAATPRQTQVLMPIEPTEEIIESVVVEPSERIAATPAPSTPNQHSSTPPQQAHQPTGSGFSAHTRLLTLAVNELRPPPPENLTTQQLKRVGHKQDRADYVADWKRSQAAEPLGETRDWEEAKSMSSEGQSLSLYKKGRGKTKAPTVNANPNVVVTLPPSVGNGRTTGSRTDKSSRRTSEKEGSVTSEMSGYEAKPEENPVTIRGTSFDGIWDTVPIDSDVSIGSAKREHPQRGRASPDATPSASQTQVKGSKIVVRLPTPKTSPLPSLAGSEHVASPLIQSATLQEPESQVVSTAISPAENPSSLIRSMLGLMTGDGGEHRHAATLDSRKADEDRSPAQIVTAATKSATPIAAIPQGHGDNAERSAEFHSAPPAPAVASAASAALPRSHSSLGSIPLEKVIIPLDDLSDVESATESELVASSKKPPRSLPDTSAAIVTMESRPAQTLHYFQRQPGIRSAVIPERHLPGMNFESMNHLAVYSPYEQQNPILSQTAHPATDGNDWRSADNQSGGSGRWQMRMENLLHSVAARQGSADNAQNEMRALRQENANLQHHLQEARQRAYGAQTAVAEKQSHIDQLSTRIGENARTAQMYEGSLAARNADLAYCRRRIEHLEGILLANQQFIAELQSKISENSQHKKTDKAEDRLRSAIDRSVESSKGAMEQSRRAEQNLASQIEKLQQSLQSKMLTEADLERKLETQAATLKERGLVLDVREANFQLAQVEKERDYYKRLAKTYDDQINQRSSGPATVFDIDPQSDGFIETTYNSPSPDRQRIPPSGMPHTPPMSGLMNTPLGKSDLRL